MGKKTPQSKGAKKKSVVVYTAVIGSRDKLRTDIPCFTTDMGFMDDRMNAKIFKILPHKFFYADFSIWVDANIYLDLPYWDKRNAEDRAIELLGDADIAVFKHRSRTNIYEEADAIKFYYPEYTPLIDEQVKDYSKMGVPTDLPFPQCGVIIRRHCPIVDAFNEAWWAEICRYSPRDQMSFPVVAANFPDLKINYLEQETAHPQNPGMKDKQLFRIIDHL